MPRIRTIKPEFWQDEKLAPLPTIDRLVFLGLISLADDTGRVLDNVKVIDAFIFPDTADSSRDSLDVLANLSRIIRYTSPSGQSLIQIVNWDHQKVDHPNLKAAFPGPTKEQLGETQRVKRPFATGSRTAREGRREIRDSISTNDLLPTTNEQQRTTSAPKSGAATIAPLPGSDAEPGTATAHPAKSRTPKVHGPPSAELHRETWITPYADAWLERYGGEMAIGPATKPLASLQKAHGDAVTLAHWRRYLTASEGQYASPARFAATFGEWNGSRSPPARAGKPNAGDEMMANTLIAFQGVIDEPDNGN